MKRSLAITPKTLRPCALDAWIVLAFLYWLCAIVASLFSSSPVLVEPVVIPLPVVAGASALFLAVGGVACFRPVSLRIWTLCLITIAVGFLLLFYAAFWLGLGFDFRFGMNRGFSQSKSKYLQEYWLWPAATITALAALFISVRCSRRWSIALVGSRSVLSFLNRHRAKMMIGFVAIMLPLMVIRNASEKESGVVSLLLLGAFFVALVIVALAVLMIILGSVFNGKHMKRKARVAGLATAAIFVCAAFAALSADVPGSMMRMLAIGTFPVLFLLALVAAHFYRADAAKHFSLWTILLVAMPIVAFTFSVIRYDATPVLGEFATGGMNVSFSTLLQTAKDSRDLKKATGSAAGMLSVDGRRVVWIQIRDEHDAECLHAIFRLYPRLTDAILIENLQPYVDTSPLRSYSGDLTVQGGQITATQLDDAAQTPSLLTLSSVRLPASNTCSTTLTSVSFVGLESRDFSGFLDAYVPTGLSAVSIQSSLSEADWRAIARHNANCTFDLYMFDENYDGLRAVAAEGADLSRVMLNNWGWPTTPRDLKLVLQANLGVQSSQSEDQQSYWNIAFSSPTSSSVFAWSDTLTDTPDNFVELARTSHWAYCWNAKGKITAIWLPRALVAFLNRKDLTELKTLRLDREGIVGFDGFHEISLSQFLRLPKLEQLYLGRSHLVEDLAFLRGLPRLRHLQIQSQPSAMKPSTGYEVCKNLETLRIFGSPDPKSVRELATLKKLQTIEIVDDENVLTGANSVAKLQEQLPGVMIRLIAPEDYQPDLSEELKRHLAKVRQETLDRLDQQIAEQK